MIPLTYCATRYRLSSLCLAGRILLMRESTRSSTGRPLVDGWALSASATLREPTRVMPRYILYSDNPPAVHSCCKCTVLADHQACDALLPLLLSAGDQSWQQGNCFCMHRSFRFSMRAMRGESGHKEDVAMRGDSAMRGSCSHNHARRSAMSRDMSKGLVTSFYTHSEWCSWSPAAGQSVEVEQLVGRFACFFRCVWCEVGVRGGRGACAC